MTHSDFRKLPFLLRDHQVLAVTGYSARTLWKLVDGGVLAGVKPAGCGERRFRKVEVALMAGLEWEEEAEGFRQEPLLMREKSVIGWTGYADSTLDGIARAGGLVKVCPAGMRAGKFRKVEVGRLIGLERYV